MGSILLFAVVAALTLWYSTPSNEPLKVKNDYFLSAKELAATWGFRSRRRQSRLWLCGAEHDLWLAQKLNQTLQQLQVINYPALLWSKNAVPLANGKPNISDNCGLDR